MWLNNTATPLERPKEFSEKPVFTEDEARTYEKQYLIDRAIATNIDNPFELDVAADIDVFEPGRVLPNRRTSLIVDPGDGKIPALTPEAQKALRDKTQHLKDHYAENPEDLRIGERCLMIGGNVAGPPMLTHFYNNNIQIVQTRDYVLIVNEMIHDARIIHLDRREHLPPPVRLWKGDGVGRWEGDALVVDTTNFNDETSLRGSGITLHVTERFSLRDPDTLRYQFTIDDPAFVRSWSADSAMSRTSGRMFEYACHEANYSMTNVLKAARFSEQHVDHVR